MNPEFWEELYQNSGKDCAGIFHRDYLKSNLLMKCMGQCAWEGQLNQCKSDLDKNAICPVCKTLCTIKDGNQIILVGDFN